MTKSELVEAMSDFPDDMEIFLTAPGMAGDMEVSSVTEICPTGTDTSENYLLIA